MGIRLDSKGKHGVFLVLAVDRSINLAMTWVWDEDVSEDS